MASSDSRGAPGIGCGSAVVAFDIGGTDMKAAMVDRAGEFHAVTRIRTPRAEDDTADPALGETARLLTEFRSARPDIVPAAAGLLVPGTVDEASGIGIYSENLNWHNVPFRERGEQLLCLPVAFGHDVREAAKAEYRLGPARSYRNVVVMMVGTGISGAIFIDGQLYSAGGMAGEMGHSRVADEPECTCGGRGCLEAVASATAIARRYNRLTGRDEPGAKEVVQRAQAGDPDAVRIWDSALDALALDLSHTVALLAPDAIVIGGGLAEAGPLLFDPLRTRLNALLTFHKHPMLLPASIGENAGLVGAALLARELVDGIGTT